LSDGTLNINGGYVERGEYLSLTKHCVSMVRSWCCHKLNNIVHYLLFLCTQIIRYL